MTIGTASNCFRNVSSEGVLFDLGVFRNFLRAIIMSKNLMSFRSRVISTDRTQWLSDPKANLLSGLVVALAPM